MKNRILIDTGEGRPEYLPNLLEAMKLYGCESIQEVLITHYHYDHTGGISQLTKHFGPLKVSKRLPPAFDERFESKAACNMSVIDDGQKIQTEGATLKAIYTPGHTDDHLSFLIEGLILSVTVT